MFCISNIEMQRIASLRTDAINRVCTTALGTRYSLLNIAHQNRN